MRLDPKKIIKFQPRQTTQGLLLAAHCAAWLTAGFSTHSAELPNYYTRVWQVEDGLPQNGVTAIVQTQDGYIWLGTHNGLVRFDGVRFKVYDTSNTPQLQSSRVTALFEDTKGDLWIGQETGDLARYSAGRFFAHWISGAWSRSKIVGIAADDSGDVWVLNNQGQLARVRDGHILIPPSGPASGLITLVHYNPGKIWIIRNGAASTLENGALKLLKYSTEPTPEYVQGISPSRTGGLWIAADGTVRKWDGTSRYLDFGPAPWDKTALSAFIELRSGALAAGTPDRGLYIMYPDGTRLHFCHTNGLPHDWVRSLCEDHEGNLWIGTGSAGLVMLRPRKVNVVSPPDNWQGRAVLAVTASRDGTLWVGTEGAGLYCMRNGQWDHFGEEAGISNLYVWSVAEDAGGTLWVGTWSGGLLVRQGNRFKRAPGTEDLNVPIPAILPLGTGELLIGTGWGLLHYNNGRTTWLTERAESQIRDVRTVTCDKSGTVWFGMYGSGLGMLKDGHPHQFTRNDGLSSDFVQSLLVDEEQETLWIGTFGGGLTRLRKGKFTPINVQHGLPNNVICSILDGGDGNFWLSTYGGLVRVSKAELDRCADGLITAVHCTVFDTADGMPTLECTGGFQPASCKTPDGILWFPTTKGLVTIDPHNIRMNPNKPHVVIEEVWAKDQPVLVNSPAANPLRIPPGCNRLQFMYTALSFTAPEKVTFKYKLDKLEQDWTEAGTKRVATYSYVPPGNYTFRVIAANNDGVWNETGAEIALTVLPLYWQTWWFRALVGVVIVSAVSGGVWFDTRRRMHRKLQLAEQQQALERERARIAKDIHDDLGANLTRITLLSQSACDKLHNPKEAAADLERIYTTAREMTRAMDEIVWAVNPHHDTLDSLANYLGKFAQDYLAAAGIRCRLDIPVHLPPWQLTSEVRHNLFLTLKEALNNTLKHAKATEVRLSLTISDTGIELIVADDGCGFVPPKFEDTSLQAHQTTRPSSGNGLLNMRQRMAEIGGKCIVESATHKGTRVRLVLPRKKAQD